MKKPEAEKRFAEIEARLIAIEGALSLNKPYDFPIGDSYTLGKKDAKLSLVIFTNMQCGYCARADKALHEAMRDPELKESINVVFKHFPFLSRAKPATKAAFAAGEQGEEKFWQMSEKIYANQKDLSDENFQAWAREIGLDTTKFAADLVNNDKKYDDILAKDLELVKMAKINSTPKVFLGGYAYDEDLTAAAIKDFIKRKKLLQ